MRMNKPVPSSKPVRPKASKRKARSDSVDHKARPPRQERSQRRFDAILDATRELLKESNIEDLSFNDIAQKAGVSPPSVHYIFPSMSALLAELIKRFHIQYSEEFRQMESRIDATDIRSWQDWVRSMAQSNRNYFNAHRDIAEMALGPIMNRASRHAIIAVNASFSHSIISTMNNIFVMPEVPDLHRKMTLALEVFDALWGRAYLERGHIDDESFEESVNIVIAYLRTILPETLALRPA